MSSCWSNGFVLAGVGVAQRMPPDAPIPDADIELVRRWPAAIERPLGSVAIGERDGAPQIRLTYPVGGEQLQPGQPVAITWEADDADTRDRAPRR